MIVVSLFDGKGTGRYVLESLGVSVREYYSFEIDPYPITINYSHYPDTMQLGDVRGCLNLSVKPDLILAASPCQGFSRAKSGEVKGFKDARSALAKYVFDYVGMHPGVPFFVENVVMAKEDSDVFSENLGVDFLRVNSNEHTAVNRDRLYWSNLPLCRPEKVEVSPKEFLGLPLGHTVGTVGSSDNRIVRETSKLGALTASMYKGIVAAGRPMVITDRRAIGLHVVEAREKGWVRMLTVAECERAHGLPVGYTSAVSKTRAYKAIGNGWHAGTVKELMRRSF